MIADRFIDLLQNAAIICLAVASMFTTSTIRRMQKRG